MDTLAASIDAFMAPLASALSAFVFFRSQSLVNKCRWLWLGSPLVRSFLRFTLDSSSGLWLAVRRAG